MDCGETGGERAKGEVDLPGIDGACFAQASRITDLPGIIGICDDPAKRGNLFFGDVTAFESKSKNKDPFPSIAFQETALIANHYCNQNKYEIEAIGVKVRNSLSLHTTAGIYISLDVLLCSIAEYF